MPAFGTSLSVPDRDFVTAAIQAKPPDNAPERRCGVTDDASHNERLDGLAVATCHFDDMLAHESTTFEHFSLIAAVRALVSDFVSHISC
jgi:hypothetical protein